MKEAERRDIETLAKRLRLAYGATAAELACLVHLTTTALNHLGSVHGANLKPLLAVQRRCVDLMAIANGLTPEEVDDALAALARASESAAYLSTLSSAGAPEQPVNLKQQATGATQKLLARVAART